MRYSCSQVETFVASIKMPLKEVRMENMCAKAPEEAIEQSWKSGKVPLNREECVGPPEPRGWCSAGVPAQMTGQQKGCVRVRGGGERGYSTLHMLLLFPLTQRKAP